ncbi:MAG: tetratricopeptide repeat protein [Candidatus Kapabacteria bacterium]|nr:tetratricopeptide repeat protein [Candidatus Kapabacteria bacterium]
MISEEIQNQYDNAIKIVDIPQKILALNSLAWNLRLQSQYEQSFNICNNAIEIAKEHNFSLEEAIILNTFANIYADIGEFSSAIDSFQNAIKLLESNYNGYWLGAIIGNCGNIYKNLGDYTTSILYYSKAIEIYENEKFTNLIPVWITNIGDIHYSQKNYLEALSYHFKALALWEKIENNSINSTPIYTNIANCYFELEEFEKSIEYNEKALEKDISNNHTMDIAIDYGNLGKIFANVNYLGYNPSKAEEYFFLAKSIFEANGNKKYQFLFHKEISELYRQQKRWEESDNHFRKFYEMEKEVLSQDALKKSQMMENRRKIEEAEKDRQIKLSRFQEQERIFHNILPISIADRLIEGEQTIAESFENVSIFFSDIVGFTTLSSNIEPSELVQGLNTIFTAFDRIGTKYGLEKIKTIGDAYMAVCGVPEVFADHAQRATKFALEAIEVLDTLGLGEDFKNLQIRIGLHCGSVVAGVIGEKKFAYDVWGDAVNIASRMESNSEAGRINVSEAFAKSIESFPEFSLIPRGEINIKGKGSMNTFWLEKGK